MPMQSRLLVSTKRLQHFARSDRFLLWGKRPQEIPPAGARNKGNEMLAIRSGLHGISGTLNDEL